MVSKKECYDHHPLIYICEAVLALMAGFSMKKENFEGIITEMNTSDRMPGGVSVM
jgi:hypothetical protein